MFSSSKEKKPRRSDRPRNTNRNLSQYGLFDIPNPDGDIGDEIDDEDDGDLEAELAALTGGSSGPKPKKKLATPLPDSQLDMLVADSLKDIPSDDDISVDENDPELLGELSELAGDEPAESPQEPEISEFPTPTSHVDPVVTVLTERLSMYQIAESNAKEAHDSSKARRYGRGIKTLNDMIKAAQKGGSVNQEEIPPPVSTAKPKPPSSDATQPSGESNQHPPAEPEAPVEPSGEKSSLPPPLVPSRGAPSLPSVTPITPPQEESPPALPPRQETPTSFAGDDTVIQLLIKRQNEYKKAALEAKKSGDSQSALTLISIFKQFEAVIKLAQSGQKIDLSDMPPPPSELSKLPQSQPIAQDQHQGSSAADVPAAPTAAAPSVGIPEEPKTVMEALTQRLEKYKSQEEAANAEGNSSKARRMGRIVKQYQDAIKMHKAGKSVPFDELPCPPGYPAIPGQTPAAPVPPHEDASLPKPAPSVPKPQPSPQPRPKQAEPAPTPSDESPKPNVRKSAGTRQEKQLNFLLERQKAFKLAAFNAKKDGDINAAKEYLRLVKQLEPLIAASESGLPVDLNTVPIPPDEKKSLESDFDVISVDECIPGSDSEIFEKLQNDLVDQLKMCMRTRDHFKAVGDIASANKFEQLALHSKKDLDVIKISQKRNDPVPRFHYEERSFSMVICNTELGDNDLELTVVQGISYNVSNPKEIDTYVKYTFPYPTETPITGKTEIIYNTNNPEYNAVFTIPIERNVRACQRVFKRHAIKLEIWSKGGFFRSDTLVGTVNAKLQPLETKCTSHEAFDLMDGRKTVGGKLEVKMRLRNPIQTKQLEQVKEKWLVIG